MKQAVFGLKRSLVASAVALAGVCSVQAAGGTWNSTAAGSNAYWTNSLNWSSSPFPATTDTATFNNSGNGRTTLDVTGLSRIKYITFDLGAVAAYTIGSNAVNSQTMGIDNDGNYKITSSAGKPQLFNAAIQLGPDTAGYNYYFQNDSPSNALTFAGNVFGAASGGTAGGKSLNVSGVGNTALLGNVTRGGATSLTINDNSSGTLTLSGSNLITTLNLNGAPTSIVDIGAGTTTFTNAGSDNIKASYDAVINGSGALILSISGTTDYANNSVAFGRTLVINARLTGNSGFEFYGGTGTFGTFVLNATNDFLRDITLNSAGAVSVARIGNKGSLTSNLGQGTNITFNANNVPGAKLVYTGVGETSDRVLVLTYSAIIEHAGTGLLKLNAPLAAGSNVKTLTLQGSTAGIGEIAGIIPVGSGTTTALVKNGSGIWRLTAANAYAGTTTVNGGTLALADSNGAANASTGYTLATGGTLLLDNTATANNTNRLRDASTVTLAGGTLSFSNSGGAANYVENAGTLAVSQFNNTVATVRADPGQTATLRFSALAPVPGATVNFTGAGLGEDSRNRIYITAQPDGLIGSWATVNGTNLAAYSSSLGVYAASDTAFADIAARGPSSTIASNATSAVRINSDGVSGAIELSDTVTRIGSLRQNTQTDATVNTADKTLQLSDIYIPEGKAGVAIGAAANDGTLSAAASGGALGLANSGNGSLTVNAVIADNGPASSLAKSGSGTVILAGSNTFSGATLVNDGLLTLANSDALQNSTLTVLTGNVGFDNAVASHAFTLGGLSGAFDAALNDSAAAPVALAVGKNNASTTHIGNLTGGGSLTKIGSGTLTLSGTNAFLGGLTVSAGTLITSNNCGLGWGPVVNNGTLNLTAGAVTYTGLSNSLSGAGTVNVTLGTGSGQASFNGNYSGFTGIWNLGIGAANGAGKAQMNGLDNGAATINVLSNATLMCNSLGTHNAALVLKGGDTGEGYGQLRLEANATWAGPVTIAGPITTTGDGLFGSTTGTGTVAGVISDLDSARPVGKLGGGILVFSNTNTYKGQTWIRAGTLAANSIKDLGQASALGAPTTLADGTLKIGDGGTGATLSYFGAGDVSERVIELSGTSGGATLDIAGSGLLKFTSALTTSGTGVKSLTLQGSSAGSGELAGVLDNGGSGRTNALVKNGSGTWTLSNANTFSGGTTINGGRLVAAHPNALGTGMVSIAGNNISTLDLSNDGGVGETAYPLTMGAGSVAAVASGRATGGEAINHRLGAMALSTVTLNITNGANVTSGTPSVTADSLNLSAGGGGATILVPTTANLSLGTVAILSSGGNAKSVQLDGTSSGNAITGPVSNGLNTVSLTKSNTSTWTLYGSNIFTGATAVNGGKLVLAGTNGALLGSSGITVSLNAALVLDNSALTNNSNRIGDAVPVALNGGVLNFSHTADASHYGETVGALTLGSASNAVSASQAAEGYTSAVTFASLTRSAAATVSFAGTELGLNERNQIRFAAIPPLVNGLIGPWATVNGTDLAGYGTYGVTVFTNYNDLAARGTGGPDSIIPDNAALNNRINVPGDSGPITLATSPVSSMNTLLQNTDTAAEVTTTGTLMRASAVLIGAGKASLNIGSAEGDGALSARAGDSELILANNSAGSVLTVNAPITNSIALALTKLGVGKVLLTGSNTYSGVTAINEGVLEFGSSSAQRLSGAISGAGTLTKSGTNLLHLMAVNTYTGPTYINQGILRVNENTTFGTAAGGVFIADGATLNLGCTPDVGGTRNKEGLNLSAELFTISGAGYDGSGAIINVSTTTQMNAMSKIALSGNATVGGTQRWDLRNGPLALNGNTLTKTGVNEIAIVNEAITPGAGHFVVNQGLLRFETTTIANGTAANTVTVNSGGIFELYEFFPSVPMYSLILNEGAFFRGSAGANKPATNLNVWAGPVTLNGRAYFNGNQSPVNWTVTGDISGTGTLVKAGNSGATLWLMGTNNTYSGGTIISNGVLYARVPSSLPGSNSGSVTVAGGGTLMVPAGDGTLSGWTSDQIHALYDANAFTTNTATLGIDTALTGLTYADSLAKPMALLKQGANTLTLAGTNTFTGALTVNGGELVMNGSANHAIGAVTIGNASLLLTNDAALYVYVTNNNTYVGNGASDFGRLTLAGNAAWSSFLGTQTVASGTMYVGYNGRGVLTVQDNAILTNKLILGYATTSHGAVYQRGNGFVQNWGGQSNDGRIGENGYGYYEQSGGTMTNNGYFQLGVNPASVGVLSQSGGTFRMSNRYGGALGISRGGTGVVYVAGGRFESFITVNVGELSGSGYLRGFAEFTVAGTGDALVTGNLNIADRTNMFATVNLNGGTLTANTLTRNARAGSLALVNFDGGTFRARQAGNLFGAGASTLDFVNIYPGGATFDTTNLACTANANLLAPAGNGVAGISITPRGGYIGPPFVTIAGGDGTGATAVAQFDSANGTVTGVIMTSHGFGYTSLPSVTLSGGGTNLQTAVTGITLAPNTGGGLTKQGTGTLTLGGTNTYGGTTTISNGILKLGNALALPSNTQVVLAGGTLDLNGFTVTNAVTGNGIITNGTLLAEISPAGTNVIGTDTFTLKSSTLKGTYLADVAADGSSDLLSVQGNLDLSNLTLQLVNPALLNSSLTYTIVSGTGSRTGTFVSANLPDSRWHVLCGADGTVKLVYVDGTLIMLK